MVSLPRGGSPWGGLNGDFHDNPRIYILVNVVGILVIVVLMEVSLK